MLLKASTELPVKSRQGVHDARAGDAQTEMGANVGEMDGDMGVRSKVNFILLETETARELPEYQKVNR